MCHEHLSVENIFAEVVIWSIAELAANHQKSQACSLILWSNLGKNISWEKRVTSSRQVEDRDIRNLVWYGRWQTRIASLTRPANVQTTLDSEYHDPPLGGMT